jgi:tetratricopeptide (TPR) repeat protein
MDCNIAKHLLVIAAAVCAIGTSGCAGPITQWMINLRNAQGDAALARPSLVEAGKEYRLALALDKKNAHARAGLAKVLYLSARADFIESHLDEAADEIAQSLHYAPDDAAALALSNEIAQAKIRREVVISNYPLYGSINAALTPSFKSVAESGKAIQKEVKLFSSDFDTSHLTKAIVNSYDLEDEVHRLAQRLILYRGYVTSGQAKATATTESNAPSLLPIP